MSAVMQTPADLFLSAQADGYVPTAAEIIEIVSTFAASAKAAAACNEAGCCCFGKPRTSSCGCASDVAPVFFKKLSDASLDAEKLHQANERRALDLQINDKTGFYI